LGDDDEGGNKDADDVSVTDSDEVTDDDISDAGEDEEEGDLLKDDDLTENESEDDLIDIDSDEIPDEDLFDRCAVVKKVANRTWTDVKTSATCTVTVKEAVFEEQETCSMLPQGDVPVNKEIYGIEFPAQTYYDSFGGVDLIIDLDESGEKPRMILTAQFKSGSSLTQEYE